MKNRISIIILLLSSAVLNAHAKDYSKHNKGYLCDVGVAFGATFPKKNDPKAVLEVFTTHGYQFSNTFFFGWGRWYLQYRNN